MKIDLKILDDGRVEIFFMNKDDTGTFLRGTIEQARDILTRATLQLEAAIAFQDSEMK